MFLKLVILIIGATHLLANNLSTGEDKHQDEECGAMAIKVMFSKLNIILLKTKQTAKLFNELNERLDELKKSVNNTKMELEANTIRQDDQANLMNELSENMASITNSMLKSLDKLVQQEKYILGRHDQQEGLLKTVAEDITSIKKYVNEHSDIKSLQRNHDWNIIQRRQDGSVRFNRNWTDYKRGFGDPNGEFFIGLEKLHALTTYGAPQELLIVLEDFHSQTRYAKYDKFEIGNETEKYAIKDLGVYSGDAGDSLVKHNGMKFSTPDQDNDLHTINCADSWDAAWWYYDCFSSNLNGRYSHTSYDRGLNWITWHRNESLKFVEMMIRPQSYIESTFHIPLNNFSTIFQLKFP